MREKYLVLFLMVLISSFAMSQMSSKENYQLIPLGEGGTKMWFFYGWEEKDGEAPQAKSFLLLKTN